MTRHERFAASALRGLLAARTNLDIKSEIGLAWRYAERMEAEAKRRELIELAAERPTDLPVTIAASYGFALALTEGYEAAIGRSANRFQPLPGQDLTTSLRRSPSSWVSSVTRN